MQDGELRSYCRSWSTEWSFQLQYGTCANYLFTTGPIARKLYAKANKKSGTKLSSGKPAADLLTKEIREVPGIVNIAGCSCFQRRWACV